MIRQRQPAEGPIMKEQNKNIQTIGGVQQGPKLLLVAGVHGDEYEPMMAAMELCRILEGRLEKGTVTIVTVANETAYGNGQRTGADGLDLARICPGRASGSSSEAAAAALSERILACDYLVDMHTGGALFDIYPLTGYLLHPDPLVLETQRRMAAAFNLPLIWGTDAGPNGRTLSVARDAGIPAIYVEYGGGNGIGMPIVNTYIEGCLGVLEELGMIPAGLMKRKQCKVRYRIEDPEPDGGFLQGKMASEFDGIFLPDVATGNRVTAGQQWGTVIDPLQHRQYPVVADRTGLVLFIRKSPRVKAGDSLGGILSINHDNNEERS
ncbi:succinylglutamate desuccinylase/aspartoacylase family protein [Niabella pedocola]|uniref:Succinylglutamate desuccinylase/aspartoacylase family protein n=1 Tax=Niabella pedocola TaxID=1752077 RepID=A0ABS8PN55_9BACT|nr:succinylglutamate desuccinylase/aspartoacylase family protein [Niabella pedocola]MCD2422547.1 succinylglutamate desuccinylase/aspartoacylase family protein [Niabella pedocola]